MLEPTAGAVFGGVEPMAMGIDDTGYYGRIGRCDNRPICDIPGWNNGLYAPILHKHCMVVQRQGIIT